MALKNDDSAAFRKSHPVDFAIFDENSHYALYIDDDPKEEHRLNLEIHNTSSRHIQFLPGKGAVSADNHHFELRFRKGVLSETTLKILGDPKQAATVLRQTDTWDMYVPAGAAQNDAVSLYFLYKGRDEFAADRRLVLTLQHISAAAGGGVRGTRVELKSNQLVYQGDATQTPITGSRMQYLHITDHRGRKNIPLRVGFIGSSSNRILNDTNPDTVEGTSNSLTLQIMNIIKPGRDHYTTPTITLRAENKAKNIPPTLLYLSFDVQVEGKKMPWAVCTEKELEHFKKPVIRPKAKWTVTDMGHDQGRAQQWSLIPNEDIVLNPGETIEIELNGLKSSLPSGVANIYLHYENIPGYYEGQFVCTIEKTPLLFSGQHVGIGTTKPGEYKLSVQGGDTLLDGALYFGDKTRQMLNLYETWYGIGVQDNTTYFRTRGNFAWFRGGSHDGNAIKPGKAKDEEGKDREGVVQMVITNDNVGIGTDSPGARLEIAAPSHGVALQIGRKSGQPSIKGVGDWLILDAPKGGQLGLNCWEKGDVIIAKGGGNVGIGVDKAGPYKLWVKGDTRVESNLDVGGDMRIVGGVKTGASKEVPAILWKIKKGSYVYMIDDTLKRVERKLNTSSQDIKQGELIWLWDFYIDLEVKFDKLLSLTGVIEIPLEALLGSAGWRKTRVSFPLDLSAQIGEDESALVEGGCGLRVYGRNNYRVGSGSRSHIVPNEWKVLKEDWEYRILVSYMA